MPIVTVELVAGDNYVMPRNLAQLLADAVGHALNSPPGQTWVRIRSVSRDQYAENGATIVAPELPVFVTILKRQAACIAELEGEAALLTRAVAGVVGRPPSCVHIEFAPPAAGRLSFGGKLVQ